MRFQGFQWTGGGSRTWGENHVRYAFERASQEERFSLQGKSGLGFGVLCNQKILMASGTPESQARRACFQPNPFFEAERLQHAR